MEPEDKGPLQPDRDTPTCLVRRSDPDRLIILHRIPFLYSSQVHFVETSSEAPRPEEIGVPDALGLESGPGIEPHLVDEAEMVDFGVVKQLTPVSIRMEDLAWKIGALVAQLDFLLSGAGEQPAVHGQVSALSLFCPTSPADRFFLGNLKNLRHHLLQVLADTGQIEVTGEAWNTAGGGQTGIIDLIAEFLFCIFGNFLEFFNIKILHCHPRPVS